MNIYIRDTQNVFKKLVKKLVKKLGEDNEDKYLLIIFLILALVIRLIVFVQNGNQPGDGMYRTILTINWLKDPYFITGGLWPPLYLYLTAFMMQIWRDPFVSPRLVSLIFGTLIIFPYYYLVKLLFDKRTAIISVLILTFLSIHIQYSTYSMSEVPFVFFLITSLYFFFRFKKNTEKRLTNLIISAIFLNLASMIRYEAWLFIPLLTIFILNKDDIKKIISLKISISNETIVNFFTFLIISMIFPVFWMIGNHNLYGDFFFGQTWSDHYIATNAILNPDSGYHNPPLIKRLIIWPGTLFLILNIVSIFAALGLLMSLVKKKNLEFLFIFIILISTFIYKLVNLTMTPQSRQIIMPILFLIPYFTIGLDGLDSIKFLNKNWNKIVTILIIGIFIIISSYTAIAKNPYITPDYVFNVSDWMKNNVKSNETVLLDDYNWWSLHILMYSGFNTTFTEDYLKTLEFVTDQVRIVPGGGKKVDELTVINYLKNKPTYLIYSSKGKLEKILNFSSKCQNETYLDYSFECIYTTENYNVYKVKNIEKEN